MKKSYLHMWKIMRSIFETARVEARIGFLNVPLLFVTGICDRQIIIVYY